MSHETPTRLFVITINLYRSEYRLASIEVSVQAPPERTKPEKSFGYTDFSDAPITFETMGRVDKAVRLALDEGIRHVFDPM